MSAYQSSPNMIFRFSMLSESPLPPKASFTIAVLRFWICSMRRSIVSETYRTQTLCEKYRKDTRQTYDEVLHIDRSLLADSVNAVNGLILYGRVPPAVHLNEQHRQRCPILVRRRPAMKT